MSKFYGQVEGASKTVATRRGFTGIKSSVQSWDGSVITNMLYEGDKLVVCISVSDESSFYGEIVFRGTIDQLKKAFENRNEKI